jgi:hypothetical protein
MIFIEKLIVKEEERDFVVGVFLKLKTVVP